MKWALGLYLWALIEDVMNKDSMKFIAVSMPKISYTLYEDLTATWEYVSFTLGKAISLLSNHFYYFMLL